MTRTRRHTECRHPVSIQQKFSLFYFDCQLWCHPVKTNQRAWNITSVFMGPMKHLMTDGNTFWVCGKFYKLKNFTSQLMSLTHVNQSEHLSPPSLPVSFLSYWGFFYCEAAPGTILLCAPTSCCPSELSCDWLSHWPCSNPDHTKSQHAKIVPGCVQNKSWASRGFIRRPTVLSWRRLFLKNTNVTKCKKRKKNVVMVSRREWLECRVSVRS